MALTAWWSLWASLPTGEDLNGFFAVFCEDYPAAYGLQEFAEDLAVFLFVVDDQGSPKPILGIRRRPRRVA